MAKWESLGAVERTARGLMLAQARERVALAVWGAILADAGRGSSLAHMENPASWPLMSVVLDGHLARRLNKDAALVSVLGERFRIVERFGMLYVGWTPAPELVGEDMLSRYEYLHVGWEKVSTLAEVQRAIGEWFLDGSAVASAVALVDMAGRMAESEAALIAAVREYERRDWEEFGGRGLSVRGVLRGAGLGDVR